MSEFPRKQSTSVFGENLTTYGVEMQSGQSIRFFSQILFYIFESIFEAILLFIFVSPSSVYFSVFFLSSCVYSVICRQHRAPTNWLGEDPEESTETSPKCRDTINVPVVLSQLSRPAFVRFSLAKRTGGSYLQRLEAWEVSSESRCVFGTVGK